MSLQCCSYQWKIWRLSKIVAVQYIKVLSTEYAIHSLKQAPGYAKATQTRFTVYRQHLPHIPSARAVIIHYLLAIFFNIMSHAPQ